MEKVEAYLAVIRPKPYHKPPENQFQADYYDILLLDIDQHIQGREIKQLPNITVPYQEHPVEKAVDFLYLLTGADRGGIKALRAVFVPPSNKEPPTNRKEVTKSALFCLIVDSSGKLNRSYVDHIPTLPGFYDLNHMFESNKINSTSLTKQTRIMLTRLQCWLDENHSKPDFISALLRNAPEERLVMSVDNPCYITRNRDIVRTFKQSSKIHPHLPFTDRCTANEAFTKLMSIEKSDHVVINPLYGSGLSYKHRVDAYSVNTFWGQGEPDCRKIRLAPACMASKSHEFAEDFPIHKLAYEGDARQITAHLKMGHSATKRDSYSWLPIHYAAWFGRVEACKVLISLGQCSPNAITSVDGWTPLHHAALNGQRYVIEYLLSLDNTDVNHLDSKRQTALNLCENSTKPKFVKCREILQASMDKPYQEIAVHVMSDVVPAILKLKLVSNTNTTVMQLHQQMLKDLQIPRGYEHFFTFWICSQNLQLQLKREHLPLYQLTDWSNQVKLLTDCQIPENEEPKLYWRRDVRLGVNDELSTLRNPNAIKLLFHEAYFNYINAFYPCDESDALKLAAVLMAIRLGEFEPNKAKHYLNSDQNLQSIVPFTQLRFKSSWVSKIFNQYKRITHDVPLDQEGKLVQSMQYNFLLICWNLTVYGSAFFNVQQISKNKGSDMIIGINDIGLHVILKDTKQIQHSFKYEEIEWLLKKEEASLDVKIKSNSRILTFKTKQAHMICSLMKRLSEINYARSR